MTQIKKASINELDSLSVLFDKYRVFYKNAPDIKNAKKFLTERITNNDAELFVCFNEENIMVAFVQLYPLFSSTRMKKLWLLNDLYVDENYRGKGYALALINKAKELCEATSACGLILETSKDNIVGNNLYSKTGFNLDKEHNFYSWNVAASSTA